MAPAGSFLRSLATEKWTIWAFSQVSSAPLPREHSGLRLVIRSRVGNVAFIVNPLRLTITTATAIATATATAPAAAASAAATTTTTTTTTAAATTTTTTTWMNGISEKQEAESFHVAESHVGARLV